MALVGEGEVSGEPETVDICPDLAAIHGALMNNNVDRIVVALDDWRGAMPIGFFLMYKLQGIILEQEINFYERLAGKIMAEKVNPSWIIFSEGFSASRAMSFLKRVFDIVLSLTLLLLVWPVILAAKLIVKLESSGPVFYC